MKEYQDIVYEMLVDGDLVYTTLNHVLDPVFLIDSSGRMIFMNSSCEKLLKDCKPSEINHLINNGLTCKGLPGKQPARSFNLKTGRMSICFNLIPIWKDGTFAGAVAAGNMKCVEDIYALMKEFREKKSNQIVETRFKPKRLLPESMQNIVGNNINFVKMLHKVAVAAKTGSTVALYGESGVGKQMIAEAIQQVSDRSSGPFIEVNCAAIPESLLESELFGYDAHTFTGALNTGKMGKFEAANGGTIFLDEVGELSLSMQAKLLRVLQSKEIEKIGGTKIKIDTRVIAATNKPLEQMVRNGSFREDLFYRLNVIPIMITPLRERKDDLDALIDNFMQRLRTRYAVDTMGLSAEVIIFFHNYNWPGNIRELENVLEYAFISARYEGLQEIRMDHLPDYFLHGIHPVSSNSDQGTQQTLKARVEKIEAGYILKTLQECNYNKTEAIKRLGISRGAFYAKLKKYKLDAII